MTKAKAKAIVNDLLDAGVNPTIAQLPSGEYLVSANTDGVAAQTVVNFATNNAVNARVRGVEFS